jgi:hypothetical protein
MLYITVLYDVYFVKPGMYIYLQYVLLLKGISSIYYYYYYNAILLHCAIMQV